MAGRATRLPQKVLAAPAMAPHLEPPLAPEAAPDLFSLFQLLCGLVSIRISQEASAAGTELPRRSPRLQNRASTTHVKFNAVYGSPAS